MSVDPGTVISSAKSLMDLAKSSLALIKKEDTDTKGLRHLFTLYVSILEFGEILESYIQFAENQLVTEISTKNMIKERIFKANVLAKRLAKKHSEIYTLCLGLDYKIKLFSEPLYKYIKEWRYRSSKSKGYPYEYNQVAHNYDAIPQKKLKAKDFLKAYNVTYQEGCFFIANMPLMQNGKWIEFMDIHKEALPFLRNFTAEIEEFLRGRAEFEQIFTA